MYGALGWLSGLVYPRLCSSCGMALDGRGGAFCNKCLAGIKRIEEPHCTICGRPFEGGAGQSHPCAACVRRRPVFDSAYAPLAFEGPVAEAVHLFKYRGMRGLADMLSSYVAEGVRDRFGEVSSVVPVPLHRRRLAFRGFNQSLTLAAVAAGELGARLMPDGLVRIKYTRPQVQLKPKERRENVKGAFAPSADFGGETVLLVDDVYTTGATVRECATVLRRAGAKAVHVMTLARAV